MLFITLSQVPLAFLLHRALLVSLILILFLEFSSPLPLFKSLR